MKAIIQAGPGGPEVLKWDHYPSPTPGEQEILIQVHAAGVNNADILQRKGLYPPPADTSPLLGLEVSGVVAQVGSGVSRWKKGDSVMAILSGGGYAEQVTIHESLAVKIPEGWSFEQAASVPEAFLTAYLELGRLGKLSPGESVLIHAGASGVGSAAIQVACALGARVFTTAGSGAKLKRCQELGAQVMINYKEEPFDQRVLKETAGRGVNCILDLVGAVHLEKNILSLATEGRLLLVGLSGGAKAELDMRQVLGKRLQIIGSTLRARTSADKAWLVESFEKFATPLFQNRKMIPVLDRVFSIQEAGDAHRYLESQANIGKVVLKLL